MGCCQSKAAEDHADRSRPVAPPVPDACYPDKAGYGGVKVLASSASSSTSTSSSYGRTHTRLVVGPDWIFAALFEAHGGGDEGGGGSSSSSADVAARYCAQQCYAEFQRATEAAARPAAPVAAAGSRGGDDGAIRNALTATLKALDQRFLVDDNIPAEDRLTCGCTAVLLHVSLGETPVATAASLGPCSAVVGQRRGGLASATSQPLVLCGGAASSHDALQDFLAALAAEQRQLALSLAPKKPYPTASSAAAKAAARKRKPSPASASSSSNASQRRLVGPMTASGGALAPAYCVDDTVPQALGFGCAKGMQLAPAGRGAATVTEPLEPVMGLQVQTASHALGPADDCVVLLSGGASAGIAPGDVALLMHRMGRLAGIPFETKPRQLPLDASRGPVAQLDSMGVAGPPPAAPPATAPAAIAPFNAARLLVQHAAANVASRGANAPAAHAAGIMAFALEWPRSSDDSASAAAASGASVAAVRAAAEAAANSRRRAQYRWQLLRLYYKFPYKRHLAIINKWHVVFDRAIGKANEVANQKEMAAWVRLQAAVKVTRGGQVECLREVGPAAPRPHYREQQRSPAPLAGGARPNRAVSGASPLCGTAHQARSPLSVAGAAVAAAAKAGPNLHSCPGGGADAPAAGGTGSGSVPRSPMSAGGSARQRSLTAGVNSARQRSPSPSLAASGTPRCASARDSRAPSAAAAVAAAGSTEIPASQAAAGSSSVRRASLPASPSRQGPVGLLEAEGIVLRDASVSKLRSGGSALGSGREREPSASASLADLPSQRSIASVGGTASVAAATPSAAAVIASKLTPSAAADRPAEDGSGPSGKRHADEAAGPGDKAEPCASAKAAVDPPVTADAAATSAIGRSPSIRATSQAATAGAAAEAASPSAAALKPADSPAMRGIPSPVAASSPRAVASPGATTTRIPSLSAGGAPISSLAGSGGDTASAAAAAGSATSRARAAAQATPRSAIPTLQLQPGPAATTAAAALSTTPRLSMPGGIPTLQRTPLSAGGAAAATTATPATATRASNTWGGATPTTSSTSAAAPNSARSGSSRLPRPANLSATMPARSGGGGGSRAGAAPAASPAGSETITKSLFAGSEAGSATKPTGPPRPPRLDVSSSMTAGSAAAATPGGGGDEGDLFSPDSAQLEAWAAEAVNAIGASAAKKQQAKTPRGAAQARSPLSQRQSVGTSAGRASATTPGGGGSWKSASLGRVASGGGAKPTQGPRIPLSPRHPNSGANNTNNTPLSRTPSHGSVSKPLRTSSNSNMGAGGTAASADEAATPPQRTASARSRR